MVPTSNKMAEIDTEKLIEAIKRRPALYNRGDEMYFTHKKQKAKIWREVYKEVFSNWDQLRPQDKVEYGHELQKRWKSLRTCFSRELASQRKDKVRKEEGLPTKRRKRYEHFDTMSFLLNPGAIEDHEVSRYSEDDDDDSTDPFETIKTEAFNNNDNTVTNSKLIVEADETPTFQQFYDRHENVEERILEMLKDMKKDEADEDRQFMLSLVPSFRKLNDKQKFEARIEILRVLRDISFKDTD